MNDESNHAVADSGVVRPRHTTDGNSPAARSKKAKHIKIGGHTAHPFDTSAVMNGTRGDERHEQTGDIQGRDYNAVESMKKAPYTNTPEHSKLGR